MDRPAAFWFGVISSITAIDVYASRNATEGDSLSECVRALFHTHHPVGRAVFVASWTALSAWFLPHITRHPGEQRERRPRPAD